MSSTSPDPGHSVNRAGPVAPAPFPAPQCHSDPFARVNVLAAVVTVHGVRVPGGIPSTFC